MERLWYPGRGKDYSDLAGGPSYEARALGVTESEREAAEHAASGRRGRWPWKELIARVARGRPSGE